MNRSVIKKMGRRFAGTWGRAAKKVGKRRANRGTRRSVFQDLIDQRDLEILAAEGDEMVAKLKEMTERVRKEGESDV